MGFGVAAIMVVCACSYVGNFKNQICYVWAWGCCCLGKLYVRRIHENVGAKLEKIDRFQIWDRMKWMFRKSQWAETYVLWNELIWVLAKVGWYIDNKTTKVENGAFDHSPCENFVMCIMVYKLFDILTFLPMQH
jgi:hypothetical protein